MDHKRESRRKGRGSHPFGSVQRPLPFYKNGYGTPFGKSAKALEIGPDPKLAMLLGNRVTWHTIRAWRRGRLEAPQYAFDVLEREYARQAERLTAARLWLDRAKEKGAD